jgi:hypothetical protein
MQGAVVVGVWHDEGGGERLGDAQHHAVLVRVDLEGAQRVVEAGDGGAGVDGLHARGQAPGDGLAGPLLPGDRRPAELQRKVALHGQVQRQETQPLLALPARHPAAEGEPFDSSAVHR